MRWGRWVLGLGLGGFLVWAAWAPLDEGVVAPASVATEGRHHAIQHMSGGVVQRVLVKEGQKVRKGDVLVELDDAAPRAAVESVRENYHALRAAESRLMAEQTDARAMAVHPDLQGPQAGETAQKHIQTQQQLFAARRTSLEADLGAQRQQLAALQTQIDGFQQVLQGRATQLKALDEQWRSLQALAQEGYAARSQVLQLEQQKAELQSQQAELQANIGKARQSMGEVQMRMAQRKAEYQREAGQALAEVQREVHAGKDKLQAVSNELQRVQIKAPVDGQVVNLTVSSDGGVVAPGQPIMSLVPSQEKLMLDARIPTQVIDRVHVGDITQVRFAGFANTPQLVLDARLVSLSSEPLEEMTPMGKQGYYLGRAEVTPEGLKALGTRQLQPGMPGEVLVRTGERNLLTYLWAPIARRVASALTEH